MVPVARLHRRARLERGVGDGVVMRLGHTATVRAHPATTATVQRTHLPRPGAASFSVSRVGEHLGQTFRVGQRHQVPAVDDCGLDAEPVLEVAALQGLREEPVVTADDRRRRHFRASCRAATARRRAGPTARARPGSCLRPPAPGRHVVEEPWTTSNGTCGSRPSGSLVLVAWRRAGRPRPTTRRAVSPGFGTIALTRTMRRTSSRADGERRREPAHRLRHERHVVRVTHRRHDRVGVLRQAGALVAGRQVDGDRTVARGLEQWNDAGASTNPHRRPRVPARSSCR